MKSNNFRYYVFLRPFQVGTWRILVISVISLIFGCIIIGLIFKPRLELSRPQMVIDMLKQSTNVVLRMFIGRKIGTEPTRLSSKVAFFVLVLGGFFIFSLYRAVLVAFVAVEIDTPPVNSLEELKKSKYLLAVRKHTAMDDIFLNSQPGTVEYYLQNNRKIFHYSGDFDSYVDKMINNTEGASHTILFYVDKIVNFSEHYPCSLLHIRSGDRSIFMIL